VLPVATAVSEKMTGRNKICVALAQDFRHAVPANVEYTGGDIPGGAASVPAYCGATGVRFSPLLRHHVQYFFQIVILMQ
jgi:hypothetical protein